jgi:hypothetical protein
MINVLSILSTSQCCTISNQHRIYIANLSSCLYIVHIVDITMLYDIESTSCLHCEPFFLFTSFTSSTSRCCTISNQHHVYIVILCSCLHSSHRDVVRYRINNIVSTLRTFLLVYIVHIIDIVMLYDIESTCRHCESFFLFTSFTSSTLRYCTISNQHRIDIANLSCLRRSHRRHHDVVRYRINIVSTL